MTSQMTGFEEIPSVKIPITTQYICIMIDDWVVRTVNLVARWRSAIAIPTAAQSPVPKVRWLLRPPVYAHFWMAGGFAAPLAKLL